MVLGSFAVQFGDHLRRCTDRRYLQPWLSRISCFFPLVELPHLFTVRYLELSFSQTIFGIPCTFKLAEVNCIKLNCELDIPQQNASIRRQ